MASVFWLVVNNTAMKVDNVFVTLFSIFWAHTSGIGRSDGNFIGGGTGNCTELHLQPFLNFLFRDLFSLSVLNCPGWAQTYDLFASASQSAAMTAVWHHTQLTYLDLMSSLDLCWVSTKNPRGSQEGGLGYRGWAQLLALWNSHSAGDPKQEAREQVICDCSRADPLRDMGGGDEVCMPGVAACFLGMGWEGGVSQLSLKPPLVPGGAGPGQT